MKMGGFLSFKFEKQEKYRGRMEFEEDEVYILKLRGMKI